MSAVEQLARVANRVRDSRDADRALIRALAAEPCDCCGELVWLDTRHEALPFPFPWRELDGQKHTCRNV